MYLIIGSSSGSAGGTQKVNMEKERKRERERERERGGGGGERERGGGREGEPAYTVARNTRTSRRKYFTIRLIRCVHSLWRFAKTTCC